MQVDRNPGAFRRQGGYTVLAVMIGIAIVSIALVSQALLAGFGVIASRQARYEHACRVAAQAVLRGAVPAEPGGSMPPDAPVDGWSDLVCLDPVTGTIVADGRGGVLVARQWRLGPDGRGRRVFEVAATAVDAAGSPLAGGLAASVVLSERVRPS